MLNNFDRFFPFPGDARHRQNGRDLPLMEDDVLSMLLSALEKLPPHANYPQQAAFYEKLLNCALLLPVPAAEQQNWDELPIMLLENSRGERALPLFTNESLLRRWSGNDEQTAFLRLSFAVLCRYAVEARVDFVVVNVTGPYGCEISFYDFSYLAEGLLPPPAVAQVLPDEAGAAINPGEMLVEKGTPMRLGELSSPPPGLLERLLHVCNFHEPLISRAYLFTVGFHGGRLQPALGVRLKDGFEAVWERDIWPMVEAILHEMLEPHTVMNVFLLNHAGKMEAYICQMTRPLFISRSASEYQP